MVNNELRKKQKRPQSAPKWITYCPATIKNAPRKIFLLLLYGLLANVAGPGQGQILFDDEGIRIWTPIYPYPLWRCKGCKKCKSCSLTASYL